MYQLALDAHLGFGEAVTSALELSSVGECHLMFPVTSFGQHTSIIWSMYNVGREETLSPLRILETRCRERVNPGGIRLEQPHFRIDKFHCNFLDKDLFNFNITDCNHAFQVGENHEARHQEEGCQDHITP